VQLSGNVFAFFGIFIVHETIIIIEKMYIMSKSALQHELRNKLYGAKALHNGGLSFTWVL
jgi:hypothetical protein